MELGVNLSSRAPLGALMVMKIMVWNKMRGIMKKIFNYFMLAAAAVVAFASCAKNVEEQFPVENGVRMKTITVMTDIQTKTTLDSDHENLVWTSQDSVSLFNNFNNTNSKLIYAEGGDMIVSVPEATTEIYAHYPYYGKNTGGPTAVSVYISNHQTQTDPGVLNGHNFPMVAKGTVTDDNKALISLYPVASALALNIYNTALEGEESVLSVTVTPASANTKFTGSQSTDITGDNIKYTEAASSDPITVTLTNALQLGNTKPANKQTFGGQIYVCLAKQSYANVKFEIKTDKGTYTITSNATPFDCVNNDFVPVNINLKNAQFEGIPEMTVVDNTTTDYTTGFEDFTAGTTYNNTEEKVDGPTGAKWASYFGTVSTNVALLNDKSMQMRWYTDHASNLGYARTFFTLTKVGYVSFEAAATNNLKLGLYYKTSEEWVLANTFDLTSSSATYSYAFDTALDNAQLKFQIVLPSTNPSNTSNVRIDDVVVKAAVPAPEATTITLSKGETSSDPIIVSAGLTVDLSTYVTTNNVAGVQTYNTSVASSIATIEGSVLTGVAEGGPFEVSLTIGASEGYVASEAKIIYVKVIDAPYKYVFTSKSWEATRDGNEDNWISGKDGSQMGNGGIQVTTNSSGANGTSPKSFINVSKIVLRYCTNGSSGAGSISVKVGNGTAKSLNVTKTGGTTVRTLEYTFSPAESGQVTITVNCTTNSIYLVGADITATSMEDPAAGITVATDEASNTTSTDGTTATLNGTITLDNGAVIGDVTGAGFYYKAGNGDFTKVSVSPSTTFSYNLTGLTPSTVTYTYYAYAVYGGNEVTGEEKTFTATTTGGGDDNSYTIIFGNNASSATAISSTTNAATVISDGTNYVTSKPFTVDSGNVYYGDTKTCIRIGKSGNYSKLTIALSDTGKVKAQSIVVNCNNTGGKNNSNATLNVNSLGAQTTTESSEDYTFTFNSATDITSLVFEGSASIRIYSITVNY